ncbi:MAG: BpuSI family type II restriction endonuclease [Clostridium sp.]|nr:BpuSI family type II restriction endonuclease [Lachnoclostridium sp.]MCM1253837.1 BpuSI family type II restriction endonuclease [Clostridium sp.]
MISYSDAEVQVFHPACERALNGALTATGNDTQYEVKHHQHIGTLEMDFVIKNKVTGKCLCVVEVKRTPADVNSIRYQYQAMSYVQHMSAAEIERPFYVITNLERAIAFRYDTARQKPFQQMLTPGLVSIGDFLSFGTEDDLINELTKYFIGIIDTFLRNNYEYFLTLDDFAQMMENMLGNRRRWKSSLAVMLYEYIRGAFQQVSRGNDLQDVRIFHHNVQQICEEASRIDFQGIFAYNEDVYEPVADVPAQLLADLFDYGRSNVTGDAIADILHQIVSDGKEHDGEVPTDLELARLAAVLAHEASGDLEDGEYICDPAAGSGNLISSAVDIYHLQPGQIKANDCNENLLELLSLRLGMCYVNRICPDNAPQITCEDITDMAADGLADVKVIVMNPPFVAGIYCVERKLPFFRRIRELTGAGPLTQMGQMPLEAAFLELVCELAPEGCVIACIFPKAHLTARGEEAQLIRQLLLGKFGLKTIFTYPGNGIFERVTKDTCVIVGTVKQTNETINVIASYEEIKDIDFARFERADKSAMTQAFSEIIPGIKGRVIGYDSLWLSIEDGWRKLDAMMIDALDYVNNYLAESTKLTQLSSHSYPIKRGTAANKGGSDLVFLDSKEELYREFTGRVRVCAGMRNAKTINTMDIGEGDSKFLDISLNDNSIIDDIINKYMLLRRTAMEEAAVEKQEKQEKTHDEWRAVLEYERRNGFAPGSVLIPRAIRTDGRAFFASCRVFVSTNFVVWTLPDETRALLAATWMTTVFYQLICEVSSSDREGMRKMEVTDIKHTWVPDFEQISAETIRRLEAAKDNVTFLQLNAPVARNIDSIWAEELFGEDAERYLQEALRLLRYLANKRNG